MGGSKSKTKKNKQQTEVIQKSVYALHPPKSFESDVDLQTTWPLWKTSFLKYMEQTTSTKDQWGYMLLNLMGPIGQSVCRKFDYKRPSDANDINILMKKMDEYYIFGHRKKYKNENAQKYFVNLEKLAASHNVSCMEEVIKKKITDEVDEIQFTRAASKFMPLFTFSQFFTLDIREIAFIWDQYEKTYNSNKNNFIKNNQTELLVHDCYYCGSNHMPRRCPAYGSHCKKCERQNHFQWKCPARICHNCKFCGGSHMASIAKCPASNSYCSNCHQKGHFVSKCRKNYRKTKYQL